MLVNCFRCPSGTLGSHTPTLRILRPHNTRSRRRITGFSRFAKLENQEDSSSELDSDSEEHDYGCYSVILPEEPYVWGTSHIRPRVVPSHIHRPPYVSSSDKRKVLDSDEERIHLGGLEEVRLRAASKLAKYARVYAGSLVSPGITTNEIDAKLHSLITERGAYPSPLTYGGFPRSCCTSVNNIIVHGIPDDRLLKDGDIVNIDITVYLDGFHGDTSETFLVGDVDDKGRELVSAAQDALHAGIAICKPGQHFREIGRVIHALATSKGYCVSSQFMGHGIGREFHRKPWIVHTLNEEPGQMQPGDCFTIEPCLIQGTNPRGWIFPDGWTTSTENCARSAQAEHTVLITSDGVDVLTR